MSSNNTQTQTRTTTEQRRRNNRQTATENNADTAVTCPECEGAVIADEKQAELVCEDCGLVIDEDQIDRGPEWRAFNSTEQRNKSRVGAPTTNTMHDKGLTTTIDWRDKDAYGRQISSRKRQQMSRLRTWQERVRTKNSGERNLKHAFGEIDRMASALGISDQVRETASVVYRRALEEDLIRGRSIEGVATAALYAATRLSNAPRPIDEFHTVSRVEESEINRTYLYLSRELDLEISPVDPKEYLNRFINELTSTYINPDEAHSLERRATDIIEEAKEANLHSGRSPTSIASAAIYTASIIEKIRFTQKEIANATETTEVTIRNRYQEMLEVYKDGKYHIE